MRRFLKLLLEVLMITDENYYVIFAIRRDIHIPIMMIRGAGAERFAREASKASYKISARKRRISDLSKNWYLNAKFGKMDADGVQIARLPGHVVNQKSGNCRIEPWWLE